MRKRALLKFLDCNQNLIYKSEYDNTYYHNGIEYLILTKNEANKEAEKHVFSFINSLDIDFVISHLKIEVDKMKLVELLNNSCNNCLNIIALFIKDYDKFINESIKKYGRSYFICFADKIEYSINYEDVTYYIYRVI